MYQSGRYVDARDAAGGAVRAGSAAAAALGGDAGGEEGRCETPAAGGHVLPTRAAAPRELQHELRHGHQGTRVCPLLEAAVGVL
ncbi:hypothetical protein ON010_g1001 [Phytophthora cinnamomi]|nr:hypothetical protein ON010_g1001 [Phytophthora cinnamomi]